MLVDRQGTTRLLRPEIQPYANPRFSPDGTRLALTIRGVAGSSDIWIENIAARTLTRFTTDGVSDQPGWTAGWAPHRLADQRRQCPVRCEVGPIRREWHTRAAGQGRVECGLCALGRSLLHQRGAPGYRWQRSISYRSTQRDTARCFKTPAPASLPRKCRPMGTGWPSCRISRACSRSTCERSRSHRDPTRSPPTAGRADLGAQRAGTRTTAPAPRSCPPPLPRPRLCRGPTRYRARRWFQLGTVFANYDVSPDGRNFVMVQSAGGETPPVIVPGWLDESVERMKQATR